MEQYNKDLRERFEEEQKTSYALQGEHILPSWNYVFWLEAGIHKLQNTTSNNKYTAPQAPPKSCQGCKHEKTFNNPKCEECERAAPDYYTKA